MMKKILIAEDDKFLATALTDKLGRDGFDVTHAVDGVAALKAVEDVKPDVIVLDLIMPKKTGFEVLAAVKANPEFKAIPVLILSNLGQDIDVDKAKKLGASDYLVKADVQLVEVVDKIKKLIKQ